MRQVLCTLCDFYVLASFGLFIFSWISIAGDSPVAIVRSFLVRVTEPLMGPLRRALPPLRLGGFGLDLSPIIVLILVQWVLAGAILGCG